MKIEIRAANRGFTWAFVASNGKQTANNEVFATRASAKRAAKAVIAAVLRGARATAVFRWVETDKDGVLTLRMVAL